MQNTNTLFNYPSFFKEWSYNITYILTKLYQSNESCQNKSGGGCLHKKQNIRKDCLQKSVYQLKKWGGIINFLLSPPLSAILCLSVRPVCLSIFQSCLSICLPVCLSVCLSLSLSLTCLPFTEILLYLTFKLNLSKDCSKNNNYFLWVRACVYCIPFSDSHLQSFQ